MLRGENVGCGVSTTGTGTLTLAAAPAAIGLVDLYVWLTAINSFGNTKQMSLPYTLFEYADANMTQPVKGESGFGVITLGTSLTGTTFARTTVTQSFNVGTPSYDAGSAPALISIGTAANVLLYFGNTAFNSLCLNPYYDQSTGDAWGVMGEASGGISSLINNGVNLNNAGTGLDLYACFLLTKPVFAKVARINVTTQASGGTPVSTAFGRLYAMGSDGKPGRLIVDFGTFGANPFTGTGFKNATAGTGAWIPPGQYWFDLYQTFSGETTHPQLMGASYMWGGNLVFAGSSGKPTRTATGGNSTAPDPANVTGWASLTTISGGVAVGFAPS